MDPIQILVFAAPVAIAALGETISQRGGVINIGLEGCMLLGAFFSMLVCHNTQNVWLGLGSGVMAGTLAGLVFGWFTVVRSADQVVVGTAVNLFARGLTGTLLLDRFGTSGTLISVPRLPAAFRIDPILAALPFLALAAWFLLKRTGYGLALRATGEYPKAAEAAGFSVSALRMSAVLVSGLMGGLAGAYLTLGVSGSFAANATGGRGFVAIAMVTFGRWRPGWVLVAAGLIGLAESLQYRIQALGIGVPFQLMLALPYIVALAVLVIVGKGTLAPAALAQPYRRDA